MSVLCYSSAKAQATTWTGATGATWGTPTNWSGGTAPTITSDVTILGPGNVAGTLAISFSAAAAADSINFTDTSAVTLTSTATETLTLSGTGNGGTAITTGSGAVVIGGGSFGLNIAMAASQTWNIGSGGMTVNNVISGTGFNLTKSGAGTLTLNGADTFSGGLTLTNGTVILGASAGAGTGTITITGGTLEAQTSGGLISYANNMAWNGNFTLYTPAKNNTFSGSVLLGATGLVITTNNDNNAKIVTLSGVISDGGNGYGLTWAGASEIVTGLNTYSGATAVQSGQLIINTINNVGGGASSLGSVTTVANGTISLGSTTTTGALTYTGVAASSNRVINLAGTTGGATLTQSGTGNLDFTSNLTATGVGAKTLTLAGSTAGTGEIDGTIVDSSSGSTALTKSGTGTWTLTGANTFTGTTTVSGGLLSLTNSLALQDSVLAVSGGTVSFNSLTVATLGGLSGATAFPTSGALTTLTLNNLASSATGTYTGVIANDTATLGLIESGTGTQVLGGVNTFTGGLNIQSGTVIATTSTSALGGSGTGAVTLGATTGTNAASLLLGGTSTLTYANPITLATNATAGTLTIGDTATAVAQILSGGVTGTNNLTVNESASTAANGMTFSTGALNNSGTITHVGTGAGTTTISGGIGANVSSLIQNSATSTLAVSGTNASFAGTVALNAGILNFGNGSLGSGTINFGGGTLQYAASNTQDVSSRIGATSSPVKVDVNGNAVSFANALTSSDTGGLTVTSTATGGKLTLNGNQSYTGLTTVGLAAANTGTLQLGTSSNLASGDNLTTLAGGTFDINGNAQTLGLVTNGGTITNSNATSSTLTIGDGSTGAGAWTGKMNVIWNQANSNSAITGSWSNTGNLTLDATGTGSLTLSTGTINNAGTISNIGTGSGIATISGVIGTAVTGVVQNSATSELVLSGANTFTSGFTLSSGTAKVTNVAGMGATSSPVALNGGTLDLETAFNATAINPYNVTVGGNVTIDSGVASGTAGNSYLFGNLSLGAYTLTAAQGSNATSAYRVEFGSTTLTGNAILDAEQGTSLFVGAGTTASPLSGNYNLTIQSVDGTGTTSIRAGSGSQTGIRTSGVTTFLSGKNNLNGTTANILGTTGTTLVLDGGSLDLEDSTSIAAYSTTVGGNFLLTNNTSGVTDGLGALSIGAYTLTTESSAATNAENITFGATTLTGNATFNVNNNAGTGSATSTLGLGALNDGGTARTITKTGNSSLILTGAATSLVSGTQVNVTGGTLNVAASSALGSVAAVDLEDGTVLSVTGTATTQTLGQLTDDVLGTTLHTASITVATGDTLTIGSATTNLSSTYGSAISGAGGIATAGTGTFTFSGVATNTGATTLTAGSTLSLAGGTIGSSAVSVNGAGANLTESAGGYIKGTSSLTVTSGTATLADANTYTGATLVNGGTLNITTGSTTGSAITVSSGSLTESTTGAINGTSGFTNSGGTTSLAGTNGYTGITAVSAGTFTATGTLATSAVNVSGSGTANLNAAGVISGATTVSVNGATANLNVNYANSALTGATAITNGTLTLGNNAGLGSSTITFNAATSSANAGILAASTTLTNVANNILLTNNSGGIAEIGGSNAITFTGTVGGSGAASRTFTLDDTAGANFNGNFYLTDQTVNEGFVFVGNGVSTINGVISNSSNGSFAGTGSTLNYAGNGTLTLANANNTYTGGTSVTGAGGTLALTGGLTGSNVLVNNATGTFTESSTGTINGAATTLTVTTGTAIIGGTNTYGGATTLTAGLLQMSGSGTLGNNSAVALNGGVFDLNSTNQTIAGLTGLAANTILNNGTGTSTLTVGSGNGTGSIASVIEDNSNSGTGKVALAKIGTGTETITGANTFSGGVSLSAGTLKLGSATALGTGAFTITGGTLDSTVASLTESNNNAQNWNGSFTFTGTNALNLGTGNVTLSNTPITITVTANTLTDNGSITDTANGANAWQDITKAGAGTLNLGENVTLPTIYGPSITGGTLELSGNITTAGNTTINTTAGTLLLAGQVDTGGSHSLTINGTGAVALTNNNNSYGGGTILNSGTLELGATGALDDNTLTINGGEISGIGSATADYSNSLIVLTANSTVAVGDATNTGAVTMGASGATFNDGSTVNANVNLTFNGAATLGTGTNNVDFSPAAGKTITFDGISGSNGLVFNGTGTATISIAGTYNETGNTLVEGGITLNMLTPSVTGGLDSLPNSITVGAGGATLVLNGGGNTADSNNPITVLAGDTVTFNNGNPSGGNIYQGPMVLGSGGVGANVSFGASTGITLRGTGTGGAGGTLTLGGNSTFTASSVAGKTGTIQSVISDGGNGYGVTFNGTTTGGLIVLAASNTFTGGVTINGGYVQLTNAGALNSAAPNSVTFGAGSTGVLELDGVNSTVNGLNSNATVGTPIVEDNSASTASTLTIANTSSSTYAGVLQNGGTKALSLIKSGTGTQTLTGINTYTGTTAINGGTLLVSGNSSAATGAVSVANGGTLGGTGTLGGAVTVAGGGAINLTDNSIGTLHTGAITIGQAGTPSALTFEVQTVGSVTTTDSIADSGNLTFIGTGGTTINIANVTGNSTLATGTYSLITYSGTLTGFSNLTLSTTSFDGDTLSLVNAAGVIELQVAAGVTTSNGQYTLATTVTGNTLLHAGGTTTVSTTISNTGTGTQDTLNYSGLGGTAASGGFSTGSTPSGTALAQGANGSNSQTYTAGSTGGTVAIGSTGSVSNTTASGTPTLISSTGTSVTVYTGLATWATNGSGSWGTLSTGFGANWGANQGSPGLDPGFTSTDTATFGGAVTSGTATVTLDGASPSLNSITFNDASANYVLAQGSGGSIALNGGTGSASVTDTAGTDTISAPVSLTTGVNVNVASGQKITFSGAISGSGGLTTTTGTGTTVLASSTGNTYSGGTTVNAGTLMMTNGTSGSATGTGTLVVGSAGTIGGIGKSASTSFNIAGHVIAGSGLASDTTGVTTITGAATLHNSTFANATLAFNLNSANTSSTSINVATTGVDFGNTTMSLTLEGNTLIGAYTPYVLVSGTNSASLAGVDGSQYTGFTTDSSGADGLLSGQYKITSGLSLNFTNDGAFYSPNSFLFLNTVGGVDDIEVEVVPEPSTWALMLGGLALLIIIQRRKRKNS